MQIKMKPETIARRAAARAAEQIARKVSLIQRLTAKVVEHGKDSIYAEMLAEQEA